MSMKLLDHLITSVKDAASFNSDLHVAPACILWTDRERQWEEIMPHLQESISELYTLGAYAPDRKIGPAIWLRTILANSAGQHQSEAAHPPIFYLPGVSRKDLRAVETCPSLLQPLIELQYRGVFWTHVNAKDWTLSSWLSSDEGGAGLEISKDAATRTALKTAFPILLDMDVAYLRKHVLDPVFLNTLVSGGDPIRDLLQWLNYPDDFVMQHSSAEWDAFNHLMQTEFGLHPHKEGALAAASRLATKSKAWANVWKRFCEAPHLYPNIPDQIRKCPLPEFDLFVNAETANSWPQWNDGQEDELRSALLNLSKMTPEQTRSTIKDLETQHGTRRGWVWAALGQSPLAQALEHLHRIAVGTSTPLATGTLPDMQERYIQSGWEIDDAVLRAMATVDAHDDELAVHAAIQACYRDWADQSAQHLQKTVEKNGYPMARNSQSEASPGDGYCVVFVDGLRFDLGKRLGALLSSNGIHLEEHPVWSALPSVTATAKPAVSPVAAEIIGSDTATDFEPMVAATGKSLSGGYHFQQLLKSSGWQVLERGDTGDPSGKAWCAFGDIDNEGHDRGWKLAKQVDSIHRDIAEQVQRLQKAGWRTIRIVTDHGWLLLPGGLPSISLPSALAENKWGRCAAIKPGTKTEERLFEWYWNPTQQYALADGIKCYRKGLDYSHGGLSLQECLTLHLTITSAGGANTLGTGAGDVSVTDVTWKGLRCTVSLSGDHLGRKLDIRLHAGDPTSSVVMTLKETADDGVASLLVENEDLTGTEAYIVILNADGELDGQYPTLIGDN